MSFRKVIIIGAICGLGFIIEAVLGDLLGRWFKPNLILITVVFFNLFWGTRYGLAAAIIGGLIKDSFGVHHFGLNILSFVSCAYLTTLVKLYVYHVGSREGRILMVFLMVIMNVTIQFIVKVVASYINIPQTLGYVLLPEVVATSVAAGYTLDKLKRCVLNLLV
jgi:rod shape-determining protein MreD